MWGFFFRENGVLTLRERERGGEKEEEERERIHCQENRKKPPECTKLHLNRTTVGRGITSLCECLFWLVRKLSIRVDGEHPIVMYASVRLYYIPILT